MGRLLLGALGTVLIVIGIPLLVLPGPGLLLIGAGGWIVLRALGKGRGADPYRPGGRSGKASEPGSVPPIPKESS
jgi:hypothetical protein